MDSDPTTPTPVDERPRRSRKSLLLIGCGGLLGLCVVLGIAAALLTSDDDDQADVASGGGTTTASLASEPTATSESQPVGTEVDPTSTASATAIAESTAEGMTPTAQSTAQPSPTATSTAEPTTEPTTPESTGEPGSARANPMPFGETATTDEWEVQVLEVVRGEPAMARLLEANQFNDPPLPGMEHVLVNVRVKYLGDETEAQRVDFSWFHATGEARVKHSWASVVTPEPELAAELFPGGEATGWVAVQARQDEPNLLLIFEPLISLDEEDEAFLALSEGASVQPLTERLAAENDLGFDRNNPVPFGEHIVGDTWEIWLIEYVRGDEALQRVKDANQFNDDPLPGMEYVLVHVGARNVKPDAGSDHLDEFSFKLTGDASRVYDVPSVVDPQPDFSYDVYPGGEVSGWITLQAGAGEQNLKVVYEPAFSFTADPRYLSLP